ncbi:metalloprotease [Nanoarchaeota archaeon]
MYKTIKLGPFKTSKIELMDLLKAWLAISVAFGIVLGGLKFDADFLFVLLLSAVTVGVGFLFHEIAHKLMAQRYGCFAEFRANNQMLMMAILFSFLGFVFAAPGAVMIGGQITKRENGIISVAGPAMNLILSLLFLGFGILFPSLMLFASYGFRINAWLAVFNMIPAWNFDGKKILRWNKTVYAAVLIIGLILAFVI